MNVIDIILVVFVFIAFLIPVFVVIVLIPITLLYNFQIKRLQKKIAEDVNERNVQKFTVWFIFGPLLKSSKRWDNLIKTFKIVNNNKEIRDETKERLYNAFKNRDCNPGELKLKNNKKITKKKNK